MDDFETVSNILQSLGASQQLIDNFLYEEIDMIALRLLGEEDYMELGCPLPIMRQLILHNQTNIFDLVE